MKRYLLAAIISISPALVFAEGNCPAGYYPIGGQGVSGCAPIGSSTSNTPQPTGEWETRWGALARDKSNSVLGVSAKESSRSAAKKVAMKFCTEAGGESCEVKVVYKNGCIAQAQSNSRGAFNTYIDTSKVLAEKNALKNCGAVDCTIGYSDCSKANFRDY
ncbi:DUF4189 domain-containing protein [Xanthomonas campestris pv. raphani]|uniref:DUF4189 domain-containing protein n=1 Tax=Xanthomonas campestris TaxID=339 RepID=UPI0009B677B9|nr:DUF4189 domain-containing protein [Xanthomonas campestris]MEA9677134.1 DUF4189 domain-containing protein [Xanthomonas campestris pv. raphani]MEA9777565.1 DUF4189 domain-containing protein [Xanthomonas campestris pv. raphani]MEA9919152.1 DUF4189 domain-containing protein [Xanthomonas campestris pv. raphani]